MKHNIKNGVHFLKTPQVYRFNKNMKLTDIFTNPNINN